MPLTDEQHKKIELAARALDRALQVLPSVSLDTDQLAAHNTVRASTALLGDGLAEVRARDVPITDTNAKVDVEAEARWAELVKSGPQIAAEQAATETQET